MSATHDSKRLKEEIARRRLDGPECLSEEDREEVRKRQLHYDDARKQAERAGKDFPDPILAQEKASFHGPEFVRALNLRDEAKKLLAKVGEGPLNKQEWLDVGCAIENLRQADQEEVIGAVRLLAAKLAEIEQAEGKGRHLEPWEFPLPNYMEHLKRHTEFVITATRAAWDHWDSAFFIRLGRAMKTTSIKRPVVNKLRRLIGIYWEPIPFLGWPGLCEFSDEALLEYCEYHLKNHSLTLDTVRKTRQRLRLRKPARPKIRSFTVEERKPVSSKES